MADEIILPKLGNTVEECIIRLWKKNLGDTVSVDDVLCEVETDKTTVDVVSTAAGVLRHVFYEENEVVSVLQTIAIVGDEDEDISLLISQHVQETVEDRAHETTPQREEHVVDTVSSPTDQEKDMAFSPRARALLGRKGLNVEQFMRHFPVKDILMNKASFIVEEQHVEDFFSQQLSHITPSAIQMLIVQDRFLSITRGSGIHNAIIEQDVLALPKCDEMREQTSPALATVSGLQGVTEYKRTSLHGIRKIISTRMMHSLQTTAQYTLHTEARAKNIVEARNQCKRDSIPITLNDIILYIVSRVLSENLWVNAILEDDTLISYRDVNLGCAVQTPRGLMVPVISCAHAMSLEEISQEMKILIEESKKASISQDKLQNGTFTVSNLGSFGIHSFTPILNVPQTGILGVGSIQTKATDDQNGGYTFDPYISLSLTLDHRAHDGAEGAMLLNKFAFAIAQYNIKNKD